MQKSRRYSGACDCGFRISDFGFQSVDKERRSKWPVAECFAKHLSNRAEKLNSQNVSKPLARIADSFPTSVTLIEVEILYPYLSSGFQDVTRRNGEVETRGNSRTSVSILNAVTLSEVEVLYPYLSSGFQDVTRRNGEVETRGNSRIPISFLTTVTLSGVEVCYSKVIGSDNDLATAGQIAESGRNANHIQVWAPDRRAVSTLSFELFTLSLSSFRMHGKTNSNEGIPIKRVFTN